MLNDSITEEIRGIRRKLAAQFDNDVGRILADVRQREASDGRDYVTLPKRAARQKTVEPARAPVPPADRFANGGSTPAAR